MRGSYSTPDVPDSSATPTTPCDGKFTFEWTDYDDQLAVTIDPATFDTPAFAGELAVTWLQVLTEFGRNERSLTTVLTTVENPASRDG